MEILNTYLTRVHKRKDIIPWDTLKYLIGEVRLNPYPLTTTYGISCQQLL